MIFYDSVAQTYQHALMIPYGQDKLLILEQDDGKYNLEINGTFQQEFPNVANMLSHIISTYPLN